MLAPPNHTPLIALPVLVLDLETTGLDVARDRVIQIGAIIMHGDKMQDTSRVEKLVNPGIPIPAASSEIHGIVDEDVTTAENFKQCTAELKDLMSGRVVLGHNIGFDIAILRHEFARVGIEWHEPTVIDIGQIVGTLQPSLPDVGLESVASYLGVTIQNRHQAMGDCQAAAEAWTRLIPILREKEIRTLGEALAFANQRQDLVLRQAQAGWLAVPGELVTVKKFPTTRRIDSYVFEQRLVDLMKRPPVNVAVETTLRDVGKAMIDHKVGALLVGDADTAPQGIITERDLLRASLDPNLNMDTAKVTTIMSHPVESMHEDEMLYRALARMDRTGVRHLCVIDDVGVPVGMVSQRDLLQHRARGPDMLSDALEAANDDASLAAAFARVTSVASRLVYEGLDGVDVARVISTELQALTGRAAQLCIDRMQAEGKGTPPADWCVLVLGSGGRGESLLSADQDNALIHDGTEDDDAWFAELGQLMAELLDAVGVPLCKGLVMASSPQWRGNIAQWNKRVASWLQRARPEDILNVDIFFDLAPVAGNAELARRLHKEATRAASVTPPFIALLAQSVQFVAPRFSLLGRLSVEDGRINLKRDGLLPLVSLARTLALRIGSQSRATPERLRDAVAAGRLAEGDAERLIELHTQLLTQVLHQQLQDIEDGIPTSSSVVVKQLGRRKYAELIQGIKHLDTMIGQTQSLISG